MSNSTRGEADAFFLRLCDDMNRGIVIGLLRSDVQCFSTEQYHEARANYMDRLFRSSAGREYFTIDTARKQLARLSRTVREVKPDVWADAATEAKEQP